MKTLNVRLGKIGYPILIGSGLLSEAGAQLKQILHSRNVAIVTNSTVGELHLEKLIVSLCEEGFQPFVTTLPDGEEYKTLETAAVLYTELNNHKANRSTPIMALGGGVIGDLTGFVAATYMRGIPMVHIPTTLLAQVDSSIGGKTAIDHEDIKNNIGAFHQPVCVLSDIAMLKTLSSTEFINGLAEVIKYAVIADPVFFNYLEKNMSTILKLDMSKIEYIVTRSARIKARFVEKDEKDTGLRNLLNYGHTFGHALESASDFQIRHGQAVSIGMVLAASLSIELGYMNVDDLGRIKSLLVRAGLPVKPPPLNIDNVMEAMLHDKKASANGLKFILPHSIGTATVTEGIGTELIIATLENIYEKP